MDLDDPDAQLYINGLDGTSGRYAHPPLDLRTLGRRLLDQPSPDEDPALRARDRRDAGRASRIAELDRSRAAKQLALEHARAQHPLDSEAIATLARELDVLDHALLHRQHRGVREGIDPTDLAQTGWGVIVPARSDPARTHAILEALTPLLELRAAQAGPRFRMVQGLETGYRLGESKSSFLRRNGASSAGAADPDVMPYYLLLLGSPEQIPYAFQYQLDVQYAVGRLWFATVDEYANYAINVVDAEIHGTPRSRTLALFGARSPDDPLTDRSTRLLVEPLHRALADTRPGWRTDAFIGEQASRAQLNALLGGDQTPALLLTAGHGMMFPPDHPRQRPHQGALLCSNWPGPRQWTEPIPERFYLAGEHLDPAADLAGMMLFCFACHSAGTPRHDAFLHRARGTPPRPLASTAFVAGLPTALLGRPRGALAVVGHVDRTWVHSFSSAEGSRARSQIATFQSTFERLLDGQPVGHALDYFNARYAELATELSAQLDDEFKRPDLCELATLWSASSDARGYVVLGDPAVRLSFEGGTTLPRGHVVSPEKRPHAGAGEPHSPVLAPPPSSSARPDEQSADAAAPSPPPPAARPDEISEADWEQTPASVRQLVEQLRAEIRRLSGA